MPPKKQPHVEEHAEVLNAAFQEAYQNILKLISNKQKDAKSRQVPFHQVLTNIERRYLVRQFIRFGEICTFLKDNEPQPPADSKRLTGYLTAIKDSLLAPLVNFRNNLLHHYPKAHLSGNETYFEDTIKFYIGNIIPFQTLLKCLETNPKTLLLRKTKRKWSNPQDYRPTETPSEQLNFVRKEIEDLVEIRKQDHSTKEHKEAVLNCLENIFTLLSDYRYDCEYLMPDQKAYFQDKEDLLPVKIRDALSTVRDSRKEISHKPAMPVPDAKIEEWSHFTIQLKEQFLIPILQEKAPALLASPEPTHEEALPASASDQAGPAENMERSSTKHRSTPPPEGPAWTKHKSSAQEATTADQAEDEEGEGEEGEEDIPTFTDS